MVHYELAIAIRARRLNLGLSIDQVSAELGLSARDYSEIESGEEDLDLLTLRAIAQLFDCHSSKILEEAQQLSLPQCDGIERALKQVVRMLQQLNRMEKQQQLISAQRKRVLLQLQLLNDAPRLFDISFEQKAHEQKTRLNMIRRIFEEKQRKLLALIVKRRYEANLIQLPLPRQTQTKWLQSD